MPVLPVYISHLPLNPPFFIIQLDRRKRVIKIVHTGNNHLLNRISSLLPQVTLYLKNLITRMPHRQGTLLQRVRRYLNLLKAVAVEAHRLPLQRRRIRRMASINYREPSATRLLSHCYVSRGTGTHLMEANMVKSPRIHRRWTPSSRGHGKPSMMESQQTC